VQGFALTRLTRTWPNTWRGDVARRGDNQPRGPGGMIG